MPAPNTLIPQIEGIMGSVAGGNQRVALWVKQIKEVLLSDSNRNKSDFEFVALTDIDEDGAAEVNAAPLTTAGALLGGVIATVSTAAERSWVIFDDADTYTFDGTAALDNGVMLAIQMPAATTAITEQFVPFICQDPLVFATGMSICADGRDGTNPTTNDLRGWILIRNNL